jgi:hypothetical protein
MGLNDRTISRLKKNDLDKQSGEEDADYFTRVTQLVDRYFIHGRARKVKPWDNYLLWLHDTLRPDKPYFRETVNIDRALRQGVGQCSQFSLIVAGVLADNGYDVRILRLLGHVVASARTQQGKWYVLDANYGVTMPHDLEYIENHPLILDEYYREIYQTIPQDVQLPMKDIFASKTNNKTYTIIGQKGWKAYYFEKFSDYLIWVLPALGLVFSFWRLRR